MLPWWITSEAICCTVAQDVPAPEIPGAVCTCLGGAGSGPALLREIGLVEFRPVRELFAFPLSEPA